MDIPQQYLAPRFLNTFSRVSAEQQIASETGATGVASATWPVANKAIYIPFVLPYRFWMKRLFVANGGTVSGNFDVGLFTMDGARIVTSGSTAQAGANSLQYVTPASDYLLVPGAYFWAMSMDNTTGTTFRSNAGGVNGCRLAGILEQTSAFVLPSSMTPAALSATYVPLCGMTSTDSGF